LLIKLRWNCFINSMCLMQLTRNKRSVFDYLIFAPCIILILVKYSSLSLPYFWDEAWPYATGVHLMYDNGLSLLPGAIPFDISRGHPLFFHLFSSLWMKIFGNTLFASHFFSLIISCGLLLTVYFFGKKYLSPETGFYSAIILCVQPVFLAQSSMLLPEIMLAMLSLFTLYFYLSGKKIPFLITSICMLLTKESGIIVLLSLLIKEFIDYFQARKKSDFHDLFFRVLLITAPVLFAFIFFLLQKIKTGYFFLPLYTDHENFVLNTILNKLSDFPAFFFIYQGRNLLSGIFILSIIFLFTTGKKTDLNEKEKNVVYLLTIFILMFLVFSASNFYSPRYLLNIFPPFIFIATYLFLRYS
jgi:4-amino-4-deoxy-L-arabinose transferase-like glycosyltransferase